MWDFSFFCRCAFVVSGRGIGMRRGSAGSETWMHMAGRKAGRSYFASALCLPAFLPVPVRAVC